MSSTNKIRPITWISDLKFNNKAIKNLPIDKSDLYYTSRQVRNAVFSPIKPCINLINPKLVSVSHSALELLHKESINHTLEEYQSSKKFVDVFCGSEILPGSEPHAHCYCGHQFGAFAGQLGDGTNSYLGEVVNQSPSTELQLKGSGKTPYSRGSDGKKVLRSSIREFLGSEHLHSLGIPTTRSATLVTSFDSLVERHDHARIFNKAPEKKSADHDQSDNKNQPTLEDEYINPFKREPAAVISRLAPTFLRFGSFEIVKSSKCEQSGKISNNPNNGELLDNLVNYSVEHFFPDIQKDKEINNLSRQEIYQKFLDQATVSTAKLVANWQAFGFCHGVLNTDNMSILGLTIDYGPYGFMDYFDKYYTCNFSDHYGRYTYDNQKAICKWNLEKFAEALSEDLAGPDVELNEELYRDSYEKYFSELMKGKLGTKELHNEGSELISSLFTTMQETRSDFVSTFLILEKAVKENHLNLTDSTDSADSNLKKISEKLAKICQKPNSIKEVMSTLMHNQELIQVVRMVQTNKIPPEYIVGQDTGPHFRGQLNRLFEMQTLSQLSEEEKFKNDAEKWSNFLKIYQKTEKSAEFFGAKSNPRIVLKNHLAQEVIVKAEEGDFKPVNDLLKKLMDPFNDDYDFANLQSNDGEVCRLVPGWAEKLCVSCSS